MSGAYTKEALALLSQMPVRIAELDRLHKCLAEELQIIDPSAKRRLLEPLLVALIRCMLQGLDQGNMCLWGLLQELTRRDFSAADALRLASEQADPAPQVIRSNMAITKPATSLRRASECPPLP